MVDRPERKYPVLLQLVFGGSFIAFILLAERLSLKNWMLWGWFSIQVFLGFLLARARIRAKRRVYRCVRCDRPVR